MTGSVSSGSLAVSALVSATGLQGGSVPVTVTSLESLANQSNNAVSAPWSATGVLNRITTASAVNYGRVLENITPPASAPSLPPVAMAPTAPTPASRSAARWP